MNITANVNASGDYNNIAEVRENEMILDQFLNEEKDFQIEESKLKF